jgi:hypothetical protein
MQRKGKRSKGGNLCFWLCTFAFDYPLLLAMQPLLLAMQRKGKRQRQKATQRQKTQRQKEGQKMQK